MSRRTSLLALLVGSLVVAGASTSNGQGSDPCTRCVPAKGEWSWKANGYAVAATAEEALETAKGRATKSACDTSATYLDAQKLKCKGSCQGGDISNACEPSKTPGCNSGTYEENKGMWTFVCRKSYEGVDSKPSCDKDEAAKHPGYTMCDVSVTAVRTLACTHPDCTEGG